MARHASAQALALYREGAISGRKAARIAEHLATCRTCTEVSVRLASVTTLLARVEMPPMPTQLANRIEMALAAERTATTSRHEHAQDAGRPAGEVTVPTPGRPDLPERSSRKRWRPRVPDVTSPRLMRGLAATAAVLLLGGVGYALANRNVLPAQVAGPKAVAPVRPKPGQSMAPLKNTTGLAGNTRQLSFTSNGRRVTYTAMASHENVTPADLAKKIHLHLDALKLQAVPTAVPGTAVSPTSASSVMAKGAKIGGVTVSQLGGCLSQVTSGRPVVIVLVARYEDKPATIIVLSPRSGDSALLDVTVVGLACSASNADIITQATIPAH